MPTRILDENQGRKAAGRLGDCDCRRGRPRRWTGMKVLYHAGLDRLMISPALALSAAEQRGKTFALSNCARCHSIDKATQSPLKIAPPFRTLHLRYPIETIAEALAEGISTGHPTMPQFQLDPDQINDLLSYLKTLE